MTKSEQLLTSIINEYEAVKQEFVTKSRIAFKEVFVDFFDKNPALTSVMWTQYTPYFNDGEPCEFTVYDPTFIGVPNDEMLEYVTDWGEWDGDDDDLVENGGSVFVGSSWNFGKFSKEQSSGIDLESVKYLESSINSSSLEMVLYDLFGDHCKVTATREGFDVTEYDHD